MRHFKLGLVINPYAGIGGALALKGSDGPEIRAKALAMGAEKRANAKTKLALEELLTHKENLTIYTAAGEMGEDLSRSMGFNTQVIYTPETSQTEAFDSQQAAACLLDVNVDLILFAGGDGTARNIYDTVADNVAVLGVPAGCKIHSGVYAITPKSAGRVVNMLIQGEIVSLSEAEVKDIDEEQFRQGRVSARYYGEMRVPTELRYVQAVKMGGKESEELVLTDIAAQIIDLMQDLPETVFVMGSGSTVAAIMHELGLENTLLGVDIVIDQQLVHQDATEQDILEFIKDKPSKLVITLIGGQGHIFGRGNQQLSPQVVNTIGRQNINIVATKTKLQSLQGRPLISDSGDTKLDAQLSGLIPVITGYRDQVLYPIAET
ncbi:MULTISPECIES: ATP-NAD kinase family protein [Aliiglaciecola]|uniref:ATP-NAD kinase family protein n=1 Tax=Aliiglaciecola TaxID=1406885 RepID=UPI001C09E03C|nr:MULTISPECIES: ATP-NAD kinase family protein [Aliiglaciecola]MBU2879959.1 ATP-NAD kinase family protein [Aliiglaciecola lipolytica]MDO6712355.1 ATP-NAD kinase family protein [Aliiglaciecola sp. 2_MG-2023]MDO6753349.1 ATP-NAD kinase family protein [Aliiglaciecola sp. 1_MG-2023]